MHPDTHGNRAQSLAEATVAPGRRTRRHRHRQAEEIYHFTKGCGTLQIDDEIQPVASGHTVLIPPGRWHSVVNEGPDDLVFLCCCSPAYGHADTELQTPDEGGDR